MSQKADDFTLYSRTVVRYMRENPNKYPEMHRLMNLKADVDVVDMIVLGVGMICAWHFNRNHTTSTAANDIEKCIFDGRMGAELLTADFGGTIH